jgi:hypothetical protein
MKGVALASLKNLSPIYPSPSILQLSELKRKLSAQTQRAGNPDDVNSDELAFLVVMIKKINNKKLSPGRTLESLSK